MGLTQTVIVTINTVTSIIPFVDLKWASCISMGTFQRPTSVHRVSVLSQEEQIKGRRKQKRFLLF